MDKLPKLVRVERYGSAARLTVDGDAFPYAIAEDGVEVGPVRTDVMPQVTVTLLAERVEVVDSFAADSGSGRPGG